MTKWEFEILGNYEGKWEIVYTATTRQEALNILHDYRKNEPNSFRIKRVLVKESESE